MNELGVVYNEKDLFTFFQSLRLQTAKRINDENLKRNEKVQDPNQPVKSWFSNLSKGVSTSVHKYKERKANINVEITMFLQKNPLAIMPRDAAISCSYSLFSDDKYGLSKIIFATSIILDTEFKYDYEAEGLTEVSEILYGNRYTLVSLKNSLFAHYKAISKSNRELSSAQKAALIGAAAVALVGIATIPVLLVGGAKASAVATTTALAAHGFADMQIGAGVVAVEAFFISAAMLGVTYGGMKIYNNAKVKEEFRKLTPERNALYLAIQCLYIEKIKADLSAEEFKTQLDEILKSLELLKADLDFYLFVEKNNTFTNKEKIRAFHEFDNRLAYILGV